VAVNPDKDRTAEEKEMDGKKYTPGENVLLKVEEKEKSLRERRREDEDRRLMEEVRGLSLREVGVDDPEARRARRRREEGRSRDSRAPVSRDTSRDHRNADDREREREQERRRRREAERRSVGNTLQPESESSDERRRRTSRERRRAEESTRTAVRQIEHQSSLRSLISSSDLDSHDMEEEILRQIREEGLLDGIDLENIDVNQEDQITERIAEAFRRRQSERARQEPARRSDASARRSQAPTSTPGSRETSDSEAVRTSRRARTHSRSPSAIRNSEQSSRPPQSISATQSTHLEVQSSDEGRHRRRRTSSGSRSSTNPIPAAEPMARPASRSQTDLSSRPASTSTVSRPVVANTPRSSTDPNVSHAVELAGSEGRPRQTQTTPNASPQLQSSARMEGAAPATTVAERRLRGAPPAEIAVPPAILSAVSQSPVERTLVPLPLSPRAQGHSRQASLSDRAGALSSGARPGSSSSASSTLGSRKAPILFPEPSVSCARCAKPHIEYELHYNCGECLGGNYNICLPCYRAAKGCLHWFGFGQAAWTKWEQLRIAGQEVDKPHMLTPSRFIPPRIAPGGADGRRTLTPDDPQKRLQSGTFCMNCFAWTNECYWRCDVCNDGDWGFCNLCVNQGRSCPHPLLPLTYKPHETQEPPLSPTHDHQAPLSASILTGPGVMDIGPFKPLTFSTKCDVCRYPIPPSQSRYHCFSCSSRVPGTLPGDYDICTSCYLKQVASRRISADNGNLGWRRCLKGHRMVIVAFEENRGGQRRVIVQDLVGGRGVDEQACSVQDYAGGELQKWSWGDGVHIRGDSSHSKLVTMDVMNVAPTTAPGMVLDTAFPPSGGVGMRCTAVWAWYPAAGADDELLFPKGAEVRECKDVTEDWAHGTYMGKSGLFPSPYVRVLDRGTGK
jgi:hypothetical protein